MLALEARRTWFRRDDENAGCSVPQKDRKFFSFYIFNFNFSFFIILFGKYFHMNTRGYVHKDRKKHEAEANCNQLLFFQINLQTPGKERK